MVASWQSDLCLVLFLVLCGLSEGEARHRPYVDDPHCPRQLQIPEGRLCHRKCLTNSDCKSSKRRCLCDGPCGNTCIKLYMKCVNLAPIINGAYKILPYNKFSATVRYTCNEGFILSGQPERKCQGDGKWSGEPPTCETEGKCRNAPNVLNAHHNGVPGQHTFTLGTQLVYICSTGYNIEGFYRAMCVGEGRWVGPRMTCSPRRCGHPGDIAHGHREGNAFVFPKRVSYACSEGYELIGKPYRECLATGQWSGTVPRCKAVKCERLTAPAHGHLIAPSDFSYGSVVRYSCERGYILFGAAMRRCQQYGAWSGKPTSCRLVDCRLPGPFYNGYIDGEYTTYGSVVTYRCYGKTTFEGPSKTTLCQENGEWSEPIPKCWRKCAVPKFPNGTTIGNDYGVYLEHRSTLQFKCNKGHLLSNESEATCYNGTWSHIPECLPAPCTDRPQDVRNGFVRFYTTDHGDRAKYKCHTGFNLIGDTYLTCSYGKWTGSKPTCEPVYCPYPGTIVHGQVLLVGILGKYEYRPYVRRIGQNEQIEFQCEKGYKRVGAGAATCVAGEWSPPDKPYCVEGQHPKLNFYRGKRAVRIDKNRNF